MSVPNRSPTKIHIGIVDWYFRTITGSIFEFAVNIHEEMRSVIHPDHMIPDTFLDSRGACYILPTDCELKMGVPITMLQSPFVIPVFIDDGSPIVTTPGVHTPFNPCLQCHLLPS